MADSSSEIKLYQHSGGQRIRSADLNDISVVARSLDAEAAFATLSREDGVVSGFNVALNSGTTFGVSGGIAVMGGQTLKDIGDPARTIEVSPNSSGSTRYDCVYLKGVSDEDETDTDTQTRVAISAFTRTAAAPFAVGTGDGATFKWDLGHSRVDPDTLVVTWDGNLVASTHSKGTGTAGVDQVVFQHNHPPPSGAIIEANYVWVSGGTESALPLPTRQSRRPTVGIAEGTPGNPPQSSIVSSGQLPLALLRVPDGWSGGSGVDVFYVREDAEQLSPPVTLDESEEIKYLVYPDKKTAGLGGDPMPRTVTSAIRGITQALHGCRLYYVDPTAIGVTPGWGVLEGVSFQVYESFGLGIQNADAASPGYISGDGWYYVYGVVDLLDGSGRGGKSFTLDISTTAPNNRRQLSDLSTVGHVYLGAIWVSSMTIREFHTVGDWTYWKDAETGAPTFTLPGPSGSGILTSTANIDVSDWCPSTGRLISMEVFAKFRHTTVDGASFDFRVNSDRVSSQKLGLSYGNSPRIKVGLEQVTLSSAAVFSEALTGVVRAEEDSGSRYVAGRADIEAGYSTVPTHTSLALAVQGYKDDYRTMDGAGATMGY